MCPDTRIVPCTGAFKERFRERRRIWQPSRPSCTWIHVWGPRRSAAGPIPEDPNAPAPSPPLAQCRYATLPPPPSGAVSSVTCAGDVGAASTTDSTCRAVTPPFDPSLPPSPRSPVARSQTNARWTPGTRLSRCDPPPVACHCWRIVARGPGLRGSLRGRSVKPLFGAAVGPSPRAPSGTHLRL